MSKIYEMQLAGRKFSVETGKTAVMANGSCIIRYGETVVHCTATASEKPRDGIDFLPLSVDYEERLYAVGKIPGSFLKREGRPSEKAILTSRVIDRPVRPLFPKDLRNDIAINCLVLSVDPDCSPEIAAMIGTSVALSISDIPWNGPIAGVAVGYIDGEIVVNPNAEQREKSELQLTVSATEQKVAMIEAGAKEISNEVMLDAIFRAHDECKKIVAFINQIVSEEGKAKFTYPSGAVDPSLFEAVKEFALSKVRFAMDTDDKNVREARMKVVNEEVSEHFAQGDSNNQAALAECMYQLQKYTVRRWLLDDGKRVDGRGLDEIRPLTAEVGLLPRTHGSGMFTRGQTQSLTIATLGPIRDAQILDGIDMEESKRYMHHYNMPPYSVGEARGTRSPGRREIGHGALAERALEPVIPSVDEFPYAIRLVSEILSSNGSTSQASICGSTLALMDAGVPIHAPVAGISCGLITEGDRWMTMVDIQGVEDFFGDMDFKVAGTKKGITAIQMDLKIDGLTPEIIKEALEKTYRARLYILDEVMMKAIPAPRAELSKYAPKMLRTQISVDKIRDVIGKGGAVIQKICAECNVKIDIEEDGSVFIAGIDIDDARRALSIVETIGRDPEVGSFYKGKVTRLMNFGAFVEIAPGKEGLVHISKLDVKRVASVEDVVSVGDEILVKVVEIDDQGRINLSRKDALIEVEGVKPQA